MPGIEPGPLVWDTSAQTTELQFYNPRWSEFSETKNELKLANHKITLVTDLLFSGCMVGCKFYNLVYKIWRYDWTFQQNTDQRKHICIEYLMHDADINWHKLKCYTILTFWLLIGLRSIGYTSSNKIHNLRNIWLIHRMEMELDLKKC